MVALKPISVEVTAVRVKVHSNTVDRAELLEEVSKYINVKLGDLLIYLAQHSGCKAALLLDPRSSTSSIFRYREFSKLVALEEDFFIYRTFKAVLINQP